MESTRQRKIVLMKGLAEYMQRLGHQIYVHPSPVKTFVYPKHTPHIYSEAELRKIFTTIDNWEQVKNIYANRFECEERQG